VQRFVAGKTLDDAIAAARRLREAGVTAVLDHLGEHVHAEHQADAARDAYLEALRRVAAERLDAHISVKLTQLGLDLSFEDCLARLRSVCAEARDVGTRVAVDMESHRHTDATIEAYRQLHPRYGHLVLCLQAYLTRTPTDLEALLPLRPAIRLCKGAYNEPKEIRLSAQKTRAAFRRMLMVLLRETPYTAVATHDELLLREAVRQARRRLLPPDRYELQMLYGVRRDLQSQFVEQGYRVRVYVPFGSEWYPYLMRRLAERPANLRLFLEAVVRG
jgi:proline dehydrogenase